jgi:hypothetical protein
MHMAIAVQMLLWAYLIRRQLLLAPWIIWMWQQMLLLHASAIRIFKFRHLC